MISIGFPTGCEHLDSQFLDTVISANHEDILRDALASYTTTLTLGGLFMNRVHVSYYTNDGCIYRSDEGGARLIGLNESKFGKFAGSINGSKTNFQFAQAVAYALILDDPRCYKGKSTDIKFFWLTTDEEFKLVLTQENTELIKGLTELYSKFQRVTPCKIYQLPGIETVFKQHPLKVHRSFDIDFWSKTFKLSEFIKYSLDSVGIPVTLFNGNNN